MNKESSSGDIFVLYEGESTGGWGERPSFEIVGYVEAEFHESVDEWINNVPDGFTHRKAELVSEFPFQKLLTSS